MPTANSGAPKDGRLNLEQQKKRAKELLKGFASGDPEALARFAAHHARATEPTLAAAQHVIAREAGFPSWPKLKAHAEALAAARAAMTHAPDTTKTLHIRCGTDIERTLRDAGFVGRFHEFSDPFCHGPVRDVPRQMFLADRTAFISEGYGHLVRDITERQRTAYAIFEELDAFSEIVLWFEHDSYDQLILAFLLAEFARVKPRPPVTLICADHVPAVSRFVGLGQLSSEVIRWLWPARRAIGSPEFAFGLEAWRAITAPTPQALHKLASSGTPLVPPMAAALMRHLKELPSTANGLSLTQQLALETIAEREGAELRALFSPYMDSEPLPFLGDDMFAHIVWEMSNARKPALSLTPAETVWRGRATLTAAGRELLANVHDWMACGPAPRWVGGVMIESGKPCWRFDHATNQVVKR